MCECCALRCIENTLFVAHRTSSSQAVINVSLCALFAIACLLLLIYGQNRIDAIKHMNQPFLFIGRLLMMLPPLLLWLQLAHWVFQYNFFCLLLLKRMKKCCVTCHLSLSRCCRNGNTVKSLISSCSVHMYARLFYNVRTMLSSAYKLAQRSFIECAVLNIVGL